MERLVKIPNPFAKKATPAPMPKDGNLRCNLPGTSSASKVVRVAHARWTHQVRWCEELRQKGVEKRPDLREAFQAALEEADLRRRTYEALIQKSA